MREVAVGMVDRSRSKEERQGNRSVSGRQREKMEPSSPIEPAGSDAERFRELLQLDAPIALQQLFVRLDPHFSNIEAGVDGQETGGKQMSSLDGGCRGQGARATGTMTLERKELKKKVRRLILP